MTRILLEIKSLGGDKVATEEIPRMNSKAKEAITAAERMRRLRTRRSNGLRCVRILLHETEIDTLVIRGYLKETRRHDPNAVESAVGQFICYELAPPEEKEGQVPN
jgi:hypothetical protein